MHVAASLIVLLACSIASGIATAAPRAPAHPEVDPASAQALAEILASDALVQEPDATPADDGRWLLHDLLRGGFAQTPALAAHLAQVADNEDLSFLRNSDWLAQLEREVLTEKLRLLPAHQAREATARLVFDIPIADHPLVDLYIDYFTGRGRWFFARWLERGDRYIPLMQPILEKHGLPKDLVYVAMIESGFAAQATSWAQASGFWQFIVSTGRLYGLKTDVWVDERRDFVRATEAAADYLAYLHKDFGDWPLAWAGYNAGEGRIRRAVAKTGVKDFWSLVGTRGILAKETQHYVPKIIAAAIVAKDRVKYGFGEPVKREPLTYDELAVDDATELGAVARKFGFDPDDLRELNPALLFGVTPPGRKAVLRVPAGHGAEVTAWLGSVPREQRLSYAHHKVEAGDSLSRIAQKHGSSIDAIREFNRITNVKRLMPGQVLVIPVSMAARRRANDATLASVNTRAPAAEPARHVDTPSPRAARAPVATPAPAPAPATQAQPQVTRHKVAAGETLWSIARTYRVSVDKVRSWNAIRHDQVHTGDVLRIFAGGDVPKT
jgi:membrane-bound lytic murein transglycosylase D